MDEQRERIQRIVAQLQEHCDSVQVFATFRYDGETAGISVGSGNWYARLGQIKDWLLRLDEQAKCETRLAHEESLDEEE